MKKCMTILFLFLFVACHKVRFTKELSVTCHGLGSSNCVAISGQDQFDYSFNTNSAAADILFVIDNSASMFSIQNSIGSKFPSLFQTIQNYDFHIGIVTTDISTSANGPRAINQNGALQDGHLVSFGSGISFLKKDTANAENLFLSTISRQETNQCEQYILNNCNQNVGCTDMTSYAANCPSEETRGIYAANLAVQNDASGFFRAGVPLSVVIISNADERASGGRISSYPLEANDQPSSLIATVNQQFGGSKSLIVQSIIIRPGDASCLLQQQFSTTVFGWYGQLYSQLSQSTGGVVGDICSANYGTQIDQISASILNQMSNQNLPCRPTNDQVTVTMNPPSMISYSLTGDNKTVLQFAQALPSNTSVRLQFTCPSL